MRADRPTLLMNAPDRMGRRLRIGGVLLFIVLAVATARTKRPWFDEAHFAAPALDLITRGTMGQPILEPLGFSSSPGIAQLRVNSRVYYSVPLCHLAQACWYRLVGFSVLRMRAFHILWGVAALFAWFYITGTLTGSVGAAVLAVFLVGTDRFFVDAAADGRPDMMSAALGTLAVAAYLALRARNLSRAVLASQALLAAALFTHPIGAVAFFAVALLAWRFDGERLRWRHLLPAGIPYAIAAAIWGLFVAQDPAAWRAQITGNSLGRFSGLTAPWAGLWKEIRVRFLDHAYLPAYATGLRRLTALIPAIYTAAVTALLFSRSGKERSGARLPAVLAVVYFLVFALFEGSKAPFYLVHFTPLLACCAAVWAASEWARGGVRRIVAGAAVGLLAVLQLSWIGYGIRRDLYHTAYVPAAEYLKQHSKPDDLVFAVSEFGFALGFYGNLRDDATLGYFTGRRAAYVVVDEPGYGEAFKGFAARNPQLDQYVRKTLAEDYRKVYVGPVYEIYQRL